MAEFDASEQPTGPGHVGRGGPGLTLFLVLGCPTFVLVAVGAELFAAQYANSDTGALARMFPLSWPQHVRALFWVGVAVAAAGFHIGLGRVDLRQPRLLIALTVVPFCLFALGIATGSSHTTWH